jgi:hypothetical protein
MQTKLSSPTSHRQTLRDEEKVCKIADAKLHALLEQCSSMTEAAVHQSAREFRRD